MQPLNPKSLAFRIQENVTCLNAVQCHLLYNLDIVTMLKCVHVLINHQYIRRQSSVLSSKTT